MCRRFSAILTDEPALSRKDSHLSGPSIPLGLHQSHRSVGPKMGPMAEKQAKEFLKRQHGFGPVNLYVDVDYWVEDIGNAQERIVVGKVGVFARAGWEKCEKMMALVDGE